MSRIEQDSCCFICVAVIQRNAKVSLRIPCELTITSLKLTERYIATTLFTFHSSGEWPEATHECRSTTVFFVLGTKNNHNILYVFVIPVKIFIKTYSNLILFLLKYKMRLGNMYCNMKYILLLRPWYLCLYKLKIILYTNLYPNHVCSQPIMNFIYIWKQLTRVSSYKQSKCPEIRPLIHASAQLGKYFVIIFVHGIRNNYSNNEEFDHYFRAWCINSNMSTNKFHW